MTRRSVSWRHSQARVRSADVRRLFILAAGAGIGLCAFALGGSLVSLAATSGAYQIMVADGASGTIFVDNATAQTVTPNTAPVGGGIASVALSPDGSSLYIAYKDGEIAEMSTVSYDFLDVTLVHQVSTSPAGMVVTPNGEDLYLAESGLNQVVEVSTTTFAQIGSPIPTGPAVNLAISPDGNLLFVDGGSDGDSVTAVSTATNTVTGNPILVPSPGEMVVSADGSALYVLTDPPSGAQVAVIALGNQNAPSRAISLPNSATPAGLTLSPGGSDLYVTDSSGEQLDHLNTTTGAAQPAADPLPQGFHPRDIATTPDGATAYVDGTNTQGQAELVSVDLATSAVGTPVILPSGTEPVALVIAPLAASTTPTPSPSAPPTPTPSPRCNPIGIGPIVILPPATGAGTAASGGGPGAAATAPPTPTTEPPSGTPTPVPGTSPTPESSPSYSPSPSPIICFNAAAVPGVGRTSGALTAGTAFPPSQAVDVRAALVAAALAGALAVAIVRFGFRPPRLRRWRKS